MSFQGVYLFNNKPFKVAVIWKVCIQYWELNVKETFALNCCLMVLKLLCIFSRDSSASLCICVFISLPFFPQENSFNGLFLSFLVLLSLSVFESTVQFKINFNIPSCPVSKSLIRVVDNCKWDCDFSKGAAVSWTKIFVTPCGLRLQSLISHGLSIVKCWRLCSFFYSSPIEEIKVKLRFRLHLNYLSIWIRI